MGATTFSVVTPVILGARVTTLGVLASSDTLLISGSTAQGGLDFSTLMIRAYATGGAVILSLNAGTTFSSIGQGNKALTSIPSEATVIIGGQDFEGSRFSDSNGKLTLTIASGTGTCSIEVYQAPRASQ